MRYDAAWSEVTYRCHLSACPACVQARDAADLLVCGVNRRNEIALAFDISPDEHERNDPANDFVYVDQAAGLTLAIEVKRPLLTDRTSEQRWQAEMAADIQRCLHGPVRCIIWCDEGWVPPRKVGRESQRRKRMCEQIADALRQEAARLGLCGVLQLQPPQNPWPRVDLSCVLETPAEGVVLTYGEGRTVTFLPTGADFRPMGIPPGQAWGWVDLSQADRQRYAAWCAALVEPATEGYRRLLAKANCQLRGRRESGCETALLFDARLENDLAYDREALHWFHKDAMDQRSVVREMSPLPARQFDHIQHILILDVVADGVQMTPVWRAADARLMAPCPVPLLPDGWLQDQ